MNLYEIHLDENRQLPTKYYVYAETKASAIAKALSHFVYGESRGEKSFTALKCTRLCASHEVIKELKQ